MNNFTEIPHSSDRFIIILIFFVQFNAACAIYTFNTNYKVMESLLMFSQNELFLLDAGYGYLKSADKEGNVNILRNAYIPSSVSDSSIPLSNTTRKVTFQIKEEGVGLMEETRIYGSGVSHITHKGSTNALKCSETRFSLACLLTEKQHKKSLTLICIHNEEKDFKKLEKDLLGSYEVTINGIYISTYVDKVLFQKEGVGTFFYLLKHKMLFPTGDVRILDLGFGLANDVILSNSGEIKFYKTTQDLTVLTVAKDIANSASYQANCTDGPQNLASIGDALEKDIPLGKMARDEWEKVKKFALLKYFKRVQQHLSVSVQGAYVNTYILTGGGSELLKHNLPKVKEAFIIPEKAGIASLLGTLEIPAVKKS